MPEGTTDNKNTGVNGWVEKHKKSIIVAGILFGAIIVWMIAKHGSQTNQGSVNTQAANSAIPSVGSPYYGGGEYGGGYATSNNFGQIQQQLASINTALNALATGNSKPAGNNPTSPAPTGIAQGSIFPSQPTQTSPGQGGGGLRPAYTFSTPIITNPTLLK